MDFKWDDRERGVQDHSKDLLRLGRAGVEEERLCSEKPIYQIAKCRSSGTLQDTRSGAQKSKAGETHLEVTRKFLALQSVVFSIK